MCLRSQGNIVNFSVIPFDPADLPRLRAALTPEWARTLPALQPLAPTVLTQLFAALAAVQHTSEELLGRMEHVLEGYLLHDQFQHASQPGPRAGSPNPGRDPASATAGWTEDREL